MDLTSFFKKFNKIIYFRSENKFNISWCFQEPCQKYIQDYFVLGEFGRTQKEKTFNKLLSHNLPKIWHKLIWKKIYRRIIDEIDRKYVAQIYSNVEFPKNNIRKMFIKQLEENFKLLNPSIRLATFSEIFLFLSELLRWFSFQITQSQDPYKPVKITQNKVCLQIYSEIREEVLARDNKLELACYLAIRANWIDSVEDNVDGFLQGFLEEVNDLLDSEADLNFQKEHNRLFQLERFKTLFQKPYKTILYEVDNSGEVILDLLLIEIILSLGHKVIIVSKEKPILNDVTNIELSNILEQKEMAPLLGYLKNNQLRLMSNNSGMTGKYLPFVSKEYKQAYIKSDLLILKGQGNFQTMPIGSVSGRLFNPYPYKKPIVYMMGIKTELIVNCINTIFKSENNYQPNTMFLYYYNYNEPLTYP
jgi:uncharacterized protein with ATP-grasp and redox domains